MSPSGFYSGYDVRETTRWGQRVPPVRVSLGEGSSAYICAICEICLPVRGRTQTGLPVPACAHRAGKRGCTQTGGWFGSPAKAKAL